MQGLQKGNTLTLCKIMSKGPWSDRGLFWSIATNNMPFFLQQMTFWLKKTESSLCIFSGNREHSGTSRILMKENLWFYLASTWSFGCMKLLVFFNVKAYPTMIFCWIWAGKAPSIQNDELESSMSMSLSFSSLFVGKISWLNLIASSITNKRVESRGKWL